MIIYYTNQKDNMGDEIINLKCDDGDTIVCYSTLHAFQTALKVAQKDEAIIEQSPTGMNCKHSNKENFIKYLKKCQIHNQVVNYGRRN